MKVFDVTLLGSLYRNGFPVSVFAEDSAQATRIAVKEFNKRQEKHNEEGKIEAQRGGCKPLELPEITAEDVSKVEVIRDQVAS